MSFIALSIRRHFNSRSIVMAFPLSVIATAMRRAFKAISVLLVLGTVFGTLIPTEARAGGWKLVFDDEFKQASLDRVTWATRYIYENETTDHLHDEAQAYKDNGNHVLHDGQLDLIARKVGDHFESGMIRSKQTFYYGYFEARVKFPSAKGIWPAFWLNSDYDSYGKVQWPPEIDIFEYVIDGGTENGNKVHSAASSAGSDSEIKYTFRNSKYDIGTRDYDFGFPLYDEWHVFGLIWTPNSITTFLDGEPLFTRPYNWSQKNKKLGAPAHILLNFAVGGKWAGRNGIDESKFPQIFSIDYVKVCQYSNLSTYGEKCGGSGYTPDPSLFGYKSKFGDLPKPKLVLVQVCGNNTSCRIPKGNGNTRPISVHTQWDNLISLKEPRGEYLILRRGKSESPVYLKIDAIKPQKRQLRSANIVKWVNLPLNFEEGIYEVSIGIAANNLALKEGSRPKFTPVSCNNNHAKLPKALECPIAKVNFGVK